MAKASKLASAGRALLLGATFAAAGLSACATVTPEQQAAFDQAAASARPQDINTFLRTYPNSELSASILNNLSSAQLSRVSPSAVAGLSPEIKQKLSADVRRQFGLRGEQKKDADGGGRGGSASY